MRRVAVAASSLFAEWRVFYLTCPDHGPALVQYRVDHEAPNDGIEHTCPTCQQPVTQVEERA